MVSINDIKKLMELRKAAQREANENKIRDQDHENKYSVGSQNTLSEINSENLRKKTGPVDTIKEIKEAYKAPSPKPEENNKKNKLDEKQRSNADALDALKKYNAQANPNKIPNDSTEAQQNAPSTISPFKKRPSPFNN